MNTLKKLIADYAAAHEELCTAIDSEPINVTALSEIERRVDRLETSFLAYRPRSRRALLTKLALGREHIMAECEESSSVGAMLADITINIGDMLAPSTKQRHTIALQGESVMWARSQRPTLQPT